MRPARPPPASHRAAGFGLVEALIALTLLAGILLATAGLFAAVPRELRRLEARREATRAIEATLESLRAGLLPAANGAVSPSVYVWTLPERPRAEGLQLWLRSDPGSAPGLFEVEVHARYEVLHRVQDRRVATQVYWP